MKNLKTILGFCCTLLLLVISSWFYVRETITPLDKDSLSSSIDSTLSQLTLVQYNQEGVIANQLTSPLMRHIPEKNIHLFSFPHIIIAQKDQPDWEIRSDKAKSLEGGKEIIFIKQVVVHQNSGEKTAESTLKTEKIVYLPQEKKASTNLLVTFEQQGNTIQSQGMNAYLDEKRVELLHKARGSYVPAQG